MLIFYRIFTFLAYHLALPVIYPAALRGSRKWKNRQGYYRSSENNSAPLIWLHASSVGEAKVAGILKKALNDAAPEAKIFLTVMTDAGFRTACDIVGNETDCGYMPLDYPAAIRRFLRHIRPDAAVFIETEIWPNLIRELARKGIPIFLANGRLSEKSGRFYRMVRGPFGRILRQYHCLMVQSRTDRERFINVGAPAETIRITGSLKFDAPANTISAEERTALKRGLSFTDSDVIWVAGSTRPGEEEIILEIFLRLRKEQPSLKIILAPRHMERLAEVKNILQGHGISYIQYTESLGNPDRPLAILVDTMGQLDKLYAVGDIAFVGGTLVNVGGHNILEPIWAGSPVLYGPSIDNVRDSSEFILENNLGEMAADREALYDLMSRFLSGKSHYKVSEFEPGKRPHSRRTAAIIIDALKKCGKKSGVE